MPCTLDTPCLNVLRPEAIIGATMYYRCGNAHTLPPPPVGQAKSPMARTAASGPRCCYCGSLLPAGRKRFHTACWASRASR